MKIEFKIKKPTMPNFILLEIPPRPKQDGFNSESNTIPVTMPVKDLDENQAIEYAQLMYDTFMDHWESMKI